MEWIDVKDQLPKETGRYFILSRWHSPVFVNNIPMKEGVACVSNFSQKKGWGLDFDNFEVTHWMPIPPLPSEKS
jgi:hypothetical protein